MKKYELLLLSTLGGFCVTSVFGVKEASWLLLYTGAPELVSLVYAAVLYGAIGGAIAFGVGVVLLLLQKIVPSVEKHAFVLGATGAIVPIGLFVGRYQLNKVWYAEQGVPMATMLGILVVIGCVVATLFLLSKWVDITIKRAMLFAMELVLFTGAISATSMSSGNPAAKKHNKEIPSHMQDKPNVLIMMIDTLRADHIAAYGKMDIDTPNLDALATDGILFEQCISQASWTRPSGVSMFTGRIPSGHSTQTKAAEVPDEAVLFSEVLQKNGVVTGGLANNINLTATFNLDQGFDTFMYEAPEYPFGGTESVFGLTLYKVVAKVKERLSPGYRKVESYYQPANVVFADAQQFITANTDSKWMLYTHLMEPHDPYFEHPIMEGGTADYNGVAYGRAEHEHPDPNDTDYLKKVYKQEVEFLDKEIGKFMSWLKEQGVYDNTVIFVIADHGEEFNEHGGFWHGTTLYDEVLHVPLVVKTAKDQPKNIRIPWQVRSIDLAPTITDIFGVEADASWEGETLLSNVEQVEKFGNLEPCQVHPLERIAVSENDFEGNILSSIRMHNWKYILANEGNPRGLGVEELYNLLEDAQEKNNQVTVSSSNCHTDLPKQIQTWKMALGEMISIAQSSAAKSTAGELDEATIERMRALGYME